MADAQAAAAGKKKYKNKKNSAEKSPNPNTNPSPSPDQDHDQEAPTSNGYVRQEEEDAAAAAEDLRGLLKQLHLCNGHGAKEQAPSPPPVEVLNGHAHGHSNNNHIQATSGGSNNNNSSHHNNSSVDSSNNNRRQRRDGDVEGIGGGGPDALHPEEKPVTATSKSTANTQTTTATATKSTVSEEGVVLQREAPVATGSGNGRQEAEEEEPLPSTLDESTTTITAECQLPEPAISAISADEIVYKEYEAEHQMHVSSTFKFDLYHILIPRQSAGHHATDPGGAVRALLDIHVPLLHLQLAKTLLPRLARQSVRGRHCVQAGHAHERAARLHRHAGRAQGVSQAQDRHHTGHQGHRGRMAGRGPIEVMGSSLG